VARHAFLQRIGNLTTRGCGQRNIVGIHRNGIKCSMQAKAKRLELERQLPNHRNRHVVLVCNVHGAASYGHCLHVFACQSVRNGLQPDDELAHLAQQQRPFPGAPA
jgi:hypothetical protein